MYNIINYSAIITSDHHWILQIELRVLLLSLLVDACSGVCLTTSAVMTA